MMENKSKSYSLVAWTDNGRVRMVPSLVKLTECELLDEIIRLREQFCRKKEDRDIHGVFTMTPNEEIEGRIDISKAYERLADFELESGSVREAWWALTKAAACCADCSDGLWIYDRNSFYPALPLLRRFYALHGRALRLIGRYPSLRKLYRGSELEEDYRTFSADRRLLREEIREADTWRKAMHFGSR